MTRFLQVTFLILAAFLCAGLAACQSPTPARLIDGLVLESTLRATLPDLGDNIHLKDNHYLTVTEKELWAAIHTGWQPYKPESGDCDDQASDIVYHLRRSFYGRGHAPAAGHVTGLVREAPHCAVWYVDARSGLKFLDPSSLAPLHPVQIVGQRAFDK
jgi:hypothetical protein